MPKDQSVKSSIFKNPKPKVQMLKVKSPNAKSQKAESPKVQMLKIPNAKSQKPKVQKFKCSNAKSPKEVQMHPKPKPQIPNAPKGSNFKTTNSTQLNSTQHQLD